MDQEEVVIQRPFRRRHKSKLADSFLIKYGLKILLGIIIVIAFLTMVQCSVKKPASPTWTTNLVLPVINRTYDMDEIVDKIDQPGLSLETNDEIYFTFEESLDTIKIEEDFGVDDISDTLTDSLGLVTIISAAPPPQTFYASQFGYSSNVPVIPKGWLSTVAYNLPQFDNFSWLTVSTGQMEVEFVNELGFDLDSVFIILQDVDSGRIVNVTQIVGHPAVPDGDTTVLTIDLSGKTISNNLSVALNCYTPGYEDWWYVAGKQATVTAGFESGLAVQAAEAEIPSVAPIDMSNTFALNSEHTILSAELTSGMLRMSIENHSNLWADMSLSLPDFIYGAAPFGLDTIIPPQSITMVNVNMTDYSFEPADQISPQEIDINATMTVSGSSSMVEIDRGDMFRVVAGLSNIQFDSMNAILSPIEMSFDNLDTIELDIPDGFDELQLSRAVMRLDFESAVSAPCLLELTVSGDAGQVPIVISYLIAGGTVSDPVTTTLIDSNLATFLNPVPHYVTISGQATLGGDGIARTISRNDYLFAGFSITSPLEVIVDTLTISGDTTSESIDQEDIDGIINHFISATFDATIDNSLPLGVMLQIYFDGDSTNLNDSAQVIKTLQVGADTVSHVSLSLDSAEIKILQNDPLYMTQDITLIGDGSNPVEIFRSDRVAIQGTINVEYRFDGEF